MTTRQFFSLARFQCRRLPSRVLTRSYSDWRSSNWNGGFFWRGWREQATPRRPFLVTSLSLGTFLTTRGKNTSPPFHPPRSKPVLPASVPIELSRIMLPDDTNPGGNVHGGTILKLIEQAGAIVATRHCNSSDREGSTPLIAVLARLEHTDFHQPMYVGEVAQLQAAVTFTSPHSMEVAVDVWAENILTGNRRHTNSAMLWYVAFPADFETLVKGEAKVARVPQLKGLSSDEARAGEKRYLQQKGSRDKVNKSQGLTHIGAYYPMSDVAEHTVLASQTTLASLILPSDCTTTGYLTGGALMKMMDNAAGICAARHCRKGVVTACIDAIDFHNPVFNGEVVFCTARLVFCSSKSMEVEVITEAEGLRPGSRRLTNTAYFTFVSLGADKKACNVPPLQLTSDEERERFEGGKERYEARKKARMMESAQNKV